MNGGLATLAEALDWVERHWALREPPSKLHRNEQEGELGLAYSHAFASLMEAQPNQTAEVTITTPCEHWQRRIPELCPTCSIRDEHGKPIVETGQYQKTVLRYRWPMWRAAVKLQNALRPRGELHPYVLIVALSQHGWSARATAYALGLPWDYAEPAFLRAIRQLHGRYEEAPVDTRRTVWTSLSVSQQNAIQAGETAA